MTPHISPSKTTWCDAAKRLRNAYHKIDLCWEQGNRQRTPATQIRQQAGELYLQFRCLCNELVGDPYAMRQALRNDDTQAREHILTYLEARPYFFRSQYIYKIWKRAMNQIQLPVSQKTRFDAILERDTRLKTDGGRQNKSWW